MVDLPNADSLWVHVPYLEHPIPAASFWAMTGAVIGSVVGSVVSLVGSLAIAYFVYRLARRQFRTNRWWERQERRYTAILNQLVTIKDAAAKLGRYDMPDLEPEDITITYTAKQHEEFRDQIPVAQSMIGKEIHRGRFLLSLEAIGILESYLWQAEKAAARAATGDVDHPDLTQWQLAVSAYEQFRDTAQRDLGAPGLWLEHRKAGHAAVRAMLDHLWLPWSPRQFQFDVEILGMHKLYLERQGGRSPPGPKPWHFRLKENLLALPDRIKEFWHEPLP